MDAIKELGKDLGGEFTPEDKFYYKYFLEQSKRKQANNEFQKTNNPEDVVDQAEDEFADKLFDEEMKKMAGDPDQDDISVGSEPFMSISDQNESEDAGSDVFEEMDGEEGDFFAGEEGLVPLDEAGEEEVEM